MARAKVKLAFIKTDSVRRVTYRKRKKFLLKKVSELSTLCGVQFCAIIFSPFDPEPVVWPSPLGVQRVIAQFEERTEMERTKKMLNQENFIKERVDMLKNHLRKQQIKNHEKEITMLMFQTLFQGNVGLQTLNLQALNDLHKTIDEKLNELQERLKAINL